MDLIPISELVKETGLTRGMVRYRMLKLKISKRLIKNQLHLTAQEFEKISSLSDDRFIKNEYKEEIIDYFNTNPENTCLQIALKYNIPYTRVHYILDNHFKSAMNEIICPAEYIILPSKMNSE